MLNIRFIRLVAAVALLATPAALRAQGFTVIVNPQNPVTELPKATVSKIFLKQARSFPEGKAATPIDLERSAAARAAFTTAVHGRTVANIEEFWLQQVFGGKDEPPAQKDEAAVVAFVAANPGAIGYVSATAASAAGVKKVTVTP